jgi:hypothetical protein
MSRWLTVMLSGLSLTACAVQEAYHTGAHDVLTALEAEVQARQGASAVGECASVPYRLPVVMQMTVPTAIVGGGLIPEHQTYVVLHPGAWVQRDGGAPLPGCRPLPEGR